MKDKHKKQITESEVQDALRKFKQQGGLIKRLPDEVVPNHNLVGSRWATYEPVQDVSSGVSENA